MQFNPSQNRLWKQLTAMFASMLAAFQHAVGYTPRVKTIAIDQPFASTRRRARRQSRLMAWARAGYVDRPDLWQFAVVCFALALVFVFATFVDQSQYRARLDAAMANPRSVSSFMQMATTSQLNLFSGEVRVIDKNRILVEFGSPEAPMVYELSNARYYLLNADKELPDVGDQLVFYWTDQEHAGSCTPYWANAEIIAQATRILCVGVKPK